MSPETQTLEASNVQVSDAQVSDAQVSHASPVVEVKVESGPLAAPSSAPQNNTEWQEILAQIKEYLSLDAINEILSDYRKPILATGVVLGSLVTLKVALAVLGAINEIPLMAPTFEMVGIGYSAWFLYRYILKASTREELSKNFNAVKRDVLGRFED